jgi:hypothetical protein
MELSFNFNGLSFGLYSWQKGCTARIRFPFPYSIAFIPARAIFTLFAARV